MHKHPAKLMGVMVAGYDFYYKLSTGDLDASCYQIV